MVDTFFNSLPEYLELIMGYVPLLFILIVPIAVYIAYQKTKREKGKAKKSAGLLGLRYINVADEMKNQRPNDALLLGLLSNWSTWAMKGTYYSMSVRVEQVVKSKQNMRIAREGDQGMSNPSSTSHARGIVFTVDFVKPLPFDFRINENFKIKFGFFKGTETDSVKSGDNELDQMAVISGSDIEKIRAWVCSEPIIKALKDLFRSLPTVNVNNNGLHYYELKGKPDYENLNNKLKILSKAAKLIGE